MYCILVTGMPAAGKTTMAGFLSRRLGIPYISKDEEKEILFDELGFSSRAEKVKLGEAAMRLMYDFADRLLERGLSVILENNFENSSREGLEELQKKHSCTAVTVRLTGDCRRIYERFLERENAPDRHRGHVVNDCYPEPCGKRQERKPLSFDAFQAGIQARGMDTFAADGPCLVVDVTDWEKVDREAVAEEIGRIAAEIERSAAGGLEKMENIAEKDRERDCKGGCRMASPGVLFMPQVPRWGIQEVAVYGPQEGNPFTEHRIRGCFQGKNETVEAEGFYDGEGRYLVRFMPSFEGEYRFEIRADFLEEEERGSFRVLPAEAGNHGPVRVADTWHFAFEDGTPYYPVGTTCYVWELQDDARIEETLNSLKDAGFNKIRFCVFPKHYDYNLKEPRSYPYEGTPMDSSVLTKENFWEYTGKTEGNHWDFTRFNPTHFQHIEKCIAALGKLGIEADLIVMHPYDRWGFSGMTKEQDDLYWNYVTARFSAFHNVWWSLANEYDLMKEKTLEDWERYAKILCEKDPYRHLRSIHNCAAFYDHSRPWVTHCSIQRQDLYRTAEYTEEWRERYRKPVVLDEIAYEGNIQYGWGNITGEEMVRRFWEAACRGGYPQHGETYLTPDEVLWWSHGGKLHGESWKRVRFLRSILEETPGRGLAPRRREWDEVCCVPQAEAGNALCSYYLFYYSFMRPSFRDFYFDEDTPFEVEVIDTWNRTVEKRGTFWGHFRVELPGRQYMAVRVRKK